MERELRPPIPDPVTIRATDDLESRVESVSPYDLYDDGGSEKFKKRLERISQKLMFTRPSYIKSKSAIEYLIKYSTSIYKLISNILGQTIKQYPQDDIQVKSIYLFKIFTNNLMIHDNDKTAVNNVKIHDLEFLKSLDTSSLIDNLITMYKFQTNSEDSIVNLLGPIGIEDTNSLRNTRYFPGGGKMKTRMRKKKRRTQKKKK